MCGGLSVLLQKSAEHAAYFVAKTQCRYHQLHFLDPSALNSRKGMLGDFNTGAVILHAHCEQCLLGLELVQLFVCRKGSCFGEKKNKQKIQVVLPQGTGHLNSFYLLEAASALQNIGAVPSRGFNPINSHLCCNTLCFFYIKALGFVI